jgi:hypothetical protein
MGVKPDSGELVEFAAQVHLRVEEVGHSVIVERHGDRTHPLAYGDELLHI